MKKQDNAQPLETAMRYLEQMHENLSLSCQPTGYSQWDELTGGLVRGGLTLVAARTAMGKTSLMLNLAGILSKKTQGTIMIFSPRENSREITVRLLQIGAGVEAEKLLDGSVAGAEATERLGSYLKERKADIQIHTWYYCNLKDLVYHCSGVPDLQLVIVDNPECICEAVDRYDWNATNRPRRAPLNQVVDSLKALARNLDVPVVCGVKLPRNLERRKDKRPRLQDLEKLRIKADIVDQIVFLYRDRYYYYFEGDDMAECIVAKTRYGQTGTVRLQFDWETGRFEQLEESSG